MVFKSIIGAPCACLTVVSFNANSALVSRLGGLAYYDDVVDITGLLMQIMPLHLGLHQRVQVAQWTKYP